MPCLIDSVSISISFQNEKETYESVTYGDCLQLWKQKKAINTGTTILDPIIILPGLKYHYSN